MNDVLGALASLKHARDHLQDWMPDEPRQMFSPYDQLGATAWVMYQPKGTVGILGTWNARCIPCSARWHRLWRPAIGRS